MGYLADQIQLPHGAALIVIDRNGTIAWLATLIRNSGWASRCRKQLSFRPSLLGKKARLRRWALTASYACTHLLRWEALRVACSVSIGIPKIIAFAAADQSLARNLVGLAVATALALAITWFLSDVFVLRQVGTWCVRHDGWPMAI